MLNGCQMQKPKRLQWVQGFWQPFNWQRREYTTEIVKIQFILTVIWSKSDRTKDAHATPYGEAWAFFYVFQIQGCAFSASTANYWERRRNSRVHRFFTHSVSLWTQKSCCREVREELRNAFFPSMGFVFPHLCRNRVVEKNSRIPWPFRNRNVAVEGWELF